MSRLPPIAPADYTPEQQRAVDEFVAARGVAISGPFETMLHSPQAMTAARAMGDYLRFRSRLAGALSELAILVTARCWAQDYEWSYHAPIAAREGVSPETIAAIRDGRRPPAMSADEAIVYDVSMELHRERSVSDATFARAEARFGRAAIVDLVGINGYYSFLAMQLNVARVGAPEGGETLPRFPD